MLAASFSIITDLLRSVTVDTEGEKTLLRTAVKIKIEISFQGWEETLQRVPYSTQLVSFVIANLMPTPNSQLTQTPSADSLL